MSDDGALMLSAVTGKARRKLRAQRTPGGSLWFGLGMVGIVGWSVAIPTVGGALLGAWHDKHQPGAHSWTLALLVAGLVVGCANAAYWVSAQTRALGPEDTDAE